MQISDSCDINCCVSTYQAMKFMVPKFLFGMRNLQLVANNMGTNRYVYKPLTLSLLMTTHRPFVDGRDQDQIAQNEQSDL